MKKVVVALIVSVVVSSGTLANVLVADSLALHPKAHYSKEASLMVQILNTYHFKKITFNDSLSSIVLDEYLQVLDNNHSYFLKSDIERFEQYRTRLDDLTSLGEIDFAFDIYNVFRQRFNERMTYVRDVLF